MVGVGRLIGPGQIDVGERSRWDRIGWDRERSGPGRPVVGPSGLGTGVGIRAIGFIVIYAVAPHTSNDAEASPRPQPRIVSERAGIQALPYDDA